MRHPAVATFNIGSSSLKFSVYRANGGVRGDCVLSGAVSGPGQSLRVKAASQTLEADVSRRLRKLDLKAGSRVPDLFSALIEALPELEIKAAGHRIVHGGSAFDGPVRASAVQIERLGELSEFAPDHQPFNLAGVAAMAERFPDLAQSLSFDTAFHRSQPRLAQLYALPQAYLLDGMLRYGFHGLSYAHLSGQLAPLLGAHRCERVVALHLGNGASLCAMLNGQSVAASMGLTAVSGIPMSTRCGDLDPGAVLYLMTHYGKTPDEVEDILNRQSGLLGVSGLSGDMRTLLASDLPTAREAVDLFTYRIAREVCSMMGALGGLDAIVFTGGIGENAPQIRAQVAARLAWLGLAVDADLNGVGQGLISVPTSKVAVGVIAADEEAIIAAETCTTCL